MSDARKRAEEALAKWDSPVARQLHEKHSDAVDCVLALRALLADAPPADAATEATGYPPTLADARMHIERLTRSLSQPHSADERFFAINEARTWLAKTAAAKADAATEAGPTRDDAMTLIGHAEYLRKCHGEEDMPRFFDALARKILALSTPAPAPSAPKVNP